MKLFWTIFLTMLIGLIGCDSAETETEAHTPPAERVLPGDDPHSYAQPNEASVEHLDLDLTVDFEKKVLRGTASMRINRAKDAKRLLLDTKHLTIERVEVAGASSEDFQEVAYVLHPADSVLGSALEIPLDTGVRHVIVHYETNPAAEALQWLEPELTLGGEAPFLLTQSQAINARTWVPIQDSPGIRFTYGANVKVPEGLMALMSARNPTQIRDDGQYSFEMTQPIPAYLLALAVGDLAFQSIGERTGVYAEPEMLEAAADEFAETEEMMERAEDLYGSYRWDRYDLLVLPPSFPFGGMENPRLTFVTPTVIVGDRSLTSLVAHELAHSWSGNLVTNATWDDFWLNEGFTVYFEYRIMEELKGRSYSEMLAELSYQDLLEEVEKIGEESPDTHLRLDLAGRNPDDAVNSIPYDKGYYFLRTIEETVGRERFDAFLEGYFTENAFQVMSTDEFLAKLERDLLSENPTWAEAIDVEAWVDGPGIPDNIARADASRFAAVDASREAFLQGKSAGALKTSEWTTHEWLHFLRNLPDDISTEKLAELDAAFGLTASNNPEIQTVWYRTAINRGYEPAYPALETFLLRIGRRKFLRPLYGALAQTEDGKRRALDIYERARPRYHPISRGTIDEILGYDA